MSTCSIALRRRVRRRWSMLLALLIVGCFDSKGPSGHVIVEQPNVTHVFLESEVRNRNSGGEQLDVPFRIIER